MRKAKLISMVLGVLTVASLAPDASADRRTWGGDRREDRRERREDRRERREDRREERREWREDRRERRRAYRAPPAVRVERYESRRGYVWIPGRWDWNGYDWVWASGRYERERAGYRWRPASYELRGDEYVMVGGDWITVDVGPTMAPPAIREERYDRRAGFFWVRGHYEWQGNQWAWIPGHYERERAGYRYVEPRYEQRNGAWVTIQGSWTVN